jgi:AcrR family transcriptional regulator
VAGGDRSGRPRDPGADALILDAALDLLIERGAGSASIEAIARRAGVAKTTVYRRWQSKEDLLAAALEHAREPDPVGAGAEPSIEELVDLTAEQLGRPRFRALMARVIGASVDHPELVAVYVERHLRPRMATVARSAQREIDAGRFPTGTDPAIVQDVLTSAIGFALLGDGDVTAERIAQRLRVLLRQLGYRGLPPRA